MRRRGRSQIAPKKFRGPDARRSPVPRTGPEPGGGVPSRPYTSRRSAPPTGLRP
jgi:hypothetical protein